MASLRNLLIVIIIWPSLVMGLSHSAEGSIVFKDISIEEALQEAKREGKYVFIETYADWCLPCKQMEVVFVDDDVATFFNTNFVNIRVNMDEPIGKELSKDYDVVFLPTLIMLDDDGIVKSKIEHLVNGPELIDRAIEAMKTTTSYHGRSLSASPFARKTKTKKREDSTDEELLTVIGEDDAPVVYVHDNRASSGRPHIMYHEAYLHLQLMDGKAQAVAKKYLSTQEDWSTEKNMRFIFDFLQDVRSREFEYFVQHRPAFEELVGAQNVQVTIEILVNLQIEKAYPRPTYDEAINLFSLVNPATARRKADEYWSSRREK